jgi:hypothetical protein
MVRIILVSAGACALSVAVAGAQGRSSVGCYIAGKRVSDDRCTPGSSSNTAAAEAARLAAQAAVEREAKALFDEAEVSTARGDYRSAVRKYHAAIDRLPSTSPNKTAYESRLRRVLTIRRGKAADDFQGAAADQRAAAEARQATRNVYDSAESRARAPLPVVAGLEPSVESVLASKLRIRIDLADPRNARVKDAFQRLTSALAHNHEGMTRGTWAPNYAHAQGRVDDLKRLLAEQGVPAPNLTVESATEAYTSYRVGVRRAK